MAVKKKKTKPKVASVRVQVNGAKETEDARARLIEAAMQLFATNGYEGTSVRELATAAGVNVAAVSYHFGSKDALYHECLRACLAPCAEMRGRMQQHLDVALGKGSRKASEDALRACIREFLELLMSPATRHSQLVMREQLEGQPRFEPIIREFFQPVGNILGQVVRLLAPAISQPDMFMVISGIIGQCLHTYKARATYRVLAGVDSHSSEYIEKVSAHMAHFAALGLRGLEREKGTN
jgi:AcrR family transcriptional regulator